MTVSIKNNVRPSSDAGQTGVGHIVNGYGISVGNDLATNKKCHFFLNFTARQTSDFHQSILLRLFFVFYRKHMENIYFDFLQLCCEVCGASENLTTKNTNKKISLGYAIQE